MNQLKEHNITLIEYFDSFIGSLNCNTLNQIVDLDSIDSVLRKLLKTDEMKEVGSFFTGQKLATLSIEAFTAPINDNSFILDPTCGAGNLLIECSRKLTIKKTLTETLSEWGKVLHGYDIYPSFIDATKLRVVLEALRRGAKKDCTLESALSFLSEIRVFDALTITDKKLKKFTHIIMNPPFTMWESPQVNYWKAGKVNAAAIVFDYYLRKLPEFCNIVAILPDVLRSGTRYVSWREYTNENIDATCFVHGKFNNKTNVDVFILSGVLKRNNDNELEWYHYKKEGKVLSSEYDVCIGPLVSYRDKSEGVPQPFINTKNATPWATIKTFTDYRPFNGRLIKGPFVVIRRTSSPSDKKRIVATLISSKNFVAVENHLIVIKPKKESLKQCKELFELLKSKDVNNYINDRIRCRHLTVGIIKDINIK